MDRPDPPRRHPSGEVIGRGVWLYFGTLTIASTLGDPGGLLGLPIMFTLKDKLGLGPQRLALFEVLTFIPVYLGFVFGFLRDRCKLFGLGDRGYLLLGAPLALLCYVYVALGQVAYAPLLVAMFVATIGYQLFDVASEALLTSVAQRHLMTGRLSALAEAAEGLPAVVALIAGGWMAAHASLRAPLLAAAGCSLVIVVHALWYPRGLFEDRRSAPAARETHGAAISRLLSHRALAAAALIGGVWNLSLAWGTPYLFFFTDELGFSSEVLGLCRAAGLACAFVAAPLYGVICRRLTLKQSLRLAVLLSLFPGFLYLGVSNQWQAVAVSVLVGLPTAFGYIALFDLMRRSCPRDLEGSGITVLHSALAVSVGIGDIVGAWLYEHAGFLICLVADALANAFVLLLLAVLPASLIAWRDGEGAPVATAAPVA